MKRAFDFVVALAGMIILSPLLAIGALGVRLFLGRPIVFRQDRPGKDARIFTLYKFRTMSDAVDDTGRPLPDEMRMTAFGNFLRNTSIDELPQLFNVLMGDMSLVGPRPLLIEYLPLYDARQRRRHEVRPGITGYSQINGRNLRSWTERLECDVWYVENRTFLLDLRILFRTVKTVLKSEGIAESGHATVRRFSGRD